MSLWLSNHLFCSIYTKSAAAAGIKASGDAQGHMTASKEKNQLCDTLLFGSLCLLFGSQVDVIGIRTALIQTTVAEEHSWFRSSVAAAAIVKIFFDIFT